MLDKKDRLNAQLIKTMAQNGTKVSNETFKQACGSLFLAGLGSDIGIDEASSRANLRILQTLAKDKEQLDILGEFLK